MEEGSSASTPTSACTGADEPFGTRCEIKNLNSLRSLGRAIEYEVRRQIALLETAGGSCRRPRHWNEDDGRTSSMRSKEEAYDYRYFPEPDLVPIDPSEEWKAAVRASLPALPADRREQLGDAWSTWPPPTSPSSSNSTSMRWWRPRSSLGADPRIAINRAANEVAAAVDGAAPLDPAAFAEVCRMEGDGRLTATQAKQVLNELLTLGRGPGGDRRRPRLQAGRRRPGRGRRRRGRRRRPRGLVALSWPARTRSRRCSSAR